MPRMTAPPIAAFSPPAPNSPITNPASSQTAMNATMTMMLLRLFRAIWWYICLENPLTGPRLNLTSRLRLPDRVLERLHRPAPPDLCPNQPIAESRNVLGMVLEVIGPHRAVLLVRRPALHLARDLGLVPDSSGGR